MMVPHDVFTILGVIAAVMLAWAIIEWMLDNWPRH